MNQFRDDAEPVMAELVHNPYQSPGVESSVPLTPHQQRIASLKRFRIKCSVIIAVTFPAMLFFLADRQQVEFLIMLPVTAYYSAMLINTNHKLLILPPG